MRIKDRLPGLLTEMGTRAAVAIRTHPRVAGAAMSALAGTAALLARRRTPTVPALPSSGEVALLTATSVHNAAKAAVLASIVDDDPQSRDLLLSAVRAAVEEASSSGVDVTSAALGAVEGSIVAAGRIGAVELDMARAAAHEAHAAAARLGFVAAQRVEGVLSPLLRDQS